MSQLKTPYYMIDETRLLDNLKIIQCIREWSGAKLVLALKCFSTWSVFDLMRNYLDGTTSSSLFEARLGYEEFGKEVHAYSVAFSGEEVEAVSQFADKIIFNSLSQWYMYRDRIRRNLKVGLRVNPGISYSHFDLADPARRYSRLGVVDKDALMKIADSISGIMFHFNCENANFDNFSASLDFIGEKYGDLLRKMEWVSLGGGIYFTRESYPVAQFCERIEQFSRKFSVQVYLEPGEAVITECAELVVTVLDCIYHEIDIAIVDASVEAHMLDHLVYRTQPRLAFPGPGEHHVVIAGRTCLAGDVFGEYSIDHPLKVGSEVRIADAAGYTIVKKNWFNGIPMPAIAVKRLNGTVELVRAFGYQDFKGNLS